MYPRRGFHDRLYDSIPIDGGEGADLIYVIIRWLITTVMTMWQS